MSIMQVRYLLASGAEPRAGSRHLGPAPAAHRGAMDISFLVDDDAAPPAHSASRPEIFAGGRPAVAPLPTASRTHSGTGTLAGTAVIAGRGVTKAAGTGSGHGRNTWTGAAGAAPRLESLPPRHSPAPPGWVSIAQPAHPDTALSGASYSTVGPLYVTYDMHRQGGFAPGTAAPSAPPGYYSAYPSPPASCPSPDASSDASVIYPPNVLGADVRIDPQRILKPFPSLPARNTPYTHPLFTTIEPPRLHYRKPDIDAVKPHICKECGRGFKTSSQVLRHRSTVHSDARKFVCRVPLGDRTGCGARFKRRDNRDVHEKTDHSVYSRQIHNM